MSRHRSNPNGGGHMHRAMIVAAGTVLLGLAFAGGMATETSRVGDLIVMRDQQGDCLAYNPRTENKTVFGKPSVDGICHLANYRKIW